MNNYNLDSNNLLEGVINEEESDSLFSINQNMNYTFLEKQNFNCLEKENSIFNQKNDNFEFNFKDILFSPNISNKVSSQESSNNIRIPNIIKEQQNSNNGNNSSSTKDKNELKIIHNKKNDKDIIHKNPILDLEENTKNNLDNTDNKVLNKKRRPRVHLEDLGIENKKYQRIGDKVILSKYQDITEKDKKEIRAERNRISAKKSRDRKKVEFVELNDKIKSLNDELNRTKLIINNYEKICCSQCKLKMEEINEKLLEDIDINNNDENYNMKNENLVLEEKDSFFLNKKNSILGKVSAVLFGLITIIGIGICLFDGLSIPKNKNTFIQQSVLSDPHQIILRHLTNNICPKENESNVIFNKDNYGNISNEINLPVPLEPLKFLQMCHDKFTWEIYNNLKKKKEIKKGNLLKIRNNENLILDNQICIETNKNNNYSINNDSNLMNNLPIEANNLNMRYKICNAIISVFVKDYEDLKKYSNGRSLPLQEQIENEAKNSEDGCAYLQMIIPRKQNKNSFNKNENYTEYESESDFFEIRCKIYSYKKYYDQGIASH